MIKNILKYYYKFENFQYKVKDDNYIINFNDDIFYFCELNISLDELSEINILLNNIAVYFKFDSIIKTIENKLYVIYENKNYVLIKVAKHNVNYNQKFLLDYNRFKFIDRGNWDELWANKVDYLEYQREHLKGKFNVINQYFDFFVGMTENAIMMFKLVKKENALKKIQHKRFERFFYDNPLNLVIDYSVRDVSEYIKYKFFYEDITINEIEEILSSFVKDNINLQLIFTRLLYPTFYFDIYDDIVNKYKKYDYKKIIKKIEKYPQLLKEIYKLSVFDKVPFKIEWLK